ncbi:hypothetical protein [Pleurocapsa sp. CCALA 161]|uniref:hypothetical protein n=1 Tax=Pleurocapsa sp. CCALA 161 TaxID=2107688 RepID=UPI00130505BA|nr:hypothetical protein [Pleurocapsa sp. CCALA 161]
MRIRKISGLAIALYLLILMKQPFMRIALVEPITSFSPSGSDSGLTSLFHHGLTSISFVLYL